MRTHSGVVPPVLTETEADPVEGRSLPSICYRQFPNPAQLNKFRAKCVGASNHARQIDRKRSLFERYTVPAWERGQTAGVRGLISDTVDFGTDSHRWIQYWHGYLHGFGERHRILGPAVLVMGASR